MDRTDPSLGSLDMGQLEALLELTVLAARADGRIDETERAAFRAHVVAKSQGSIDAALADVIFDTLDRAVAQQDLDERLARIRARITDPRMRESALAMATDIAFADGVFHVDEEKFLERAAKVLEIDSEKARDIVAESRRG
jgi:tellurite resistance protein